MVSQRDPGKYWEVPGAYQENSGTFQLGLKGLQEAFWRISRGLSGVFGHPKGFQGHLRRSLRRFRRTQRVTGVFQEATGGLRGIY